MAPRTHPVPGLRSPSGAPVILAASAPAAPAVAKPPVGPQTARHGALYGGGFGSYLGWAEKYAEKYFGPFNPRWVPDWQLKLMQTDWTIGFCQEIWLSGFGAADYFFDGGSGEIRGYFETTLRPKSWSPRLLQARNYGRQTCEIVWAAKDVSYTYAKEGGKPGETVTAERIGAYVVEDLRDLDPELTQVLEDTKGDFAGVRYRGDELAKDRLLHVVNESEFGGLLGRPQLLRANNPWWWGNVAYLGCNRYLQNKGDPPLIGFAPTEEMVDAQGNAQNPIAVTAIGLANLRSSGSYVFPQIYDPESKQPLFGVRSLEVANRAPEFLEIIDKHEHNKRLACLIPGGLGQGASFASDKVSQQLVDRFFDRHLLALVLDPINTILIPRIAAVNFPGVKASDLPTLRAGNMAIGARQDFFELVRAAIALDGVLPDGRNAKIVQMIDWMTGMKKGNVATHPTALVPTAPIEVSAPAEGTYPTAGQPPSIAPEKDRPNAPGRPGMPSLARALSAAAVAVKRGDEPVPPIPPTDSTLESVGVFIPLPTGPGALSAEWPASGRQGEDDSPPHITVLYVGKVKPDQLQHVVAAARIALRHQAPFEISMSRYGEFANDAGQTIAHMIPDAPELEYMHHDLRRTIEQVGVKPQHREGGFLPHATLAYLGTEAYAGPKPRGAWTAKGVEVWADGPEGSQKIGIPFEGAWDRPTALSAAVVAQAQEAEKWLDTTVAGLAGIDQTIFKAARLAEAERQSLEAEIRNLLMKAIARAKTEDGALHADNRTIAADLGRKVDALLQKSMDEDLLDDAEIDDKALGLAKGPASPLAAAHAQAFKGAADLLEKLGIPASNRVVARKTVKDIVRDAKSNGRGVVHRETRRVTEALDRLVIGTAPTETAEALADGYKLPPRDFVASTVHHVRATARATIATAGEKAGATRWLIATGPGSESRVLDSAPTGGVAEQLWTVKSTEDLDALYHGIVVDDERPVTSWRNLGLNFGSPEMYLPLPTDDEDLATALVAAAAARRAAWNADRETRQAKLHELNAAAAESVEGQALARGQGSDDVKRDEVEAIVARALAAAKASAPASATAQPPPAFNMSMNVQSATLSLPEGSAATVLAQMAKPEPAIIQGLVVHTHVDKGAVQVAVAPTPPTPVQVLPAPPTPITFAPTIQPAPAGEVHVVADVKLPQRPQIVATITHDDGTSSTIEETKP